LVLTLVCVSSAQVTTALNGSYTIDPAGSGSRNFQTFALANTALQAGVSGAVTFNVASTTFNEAVVIAPATGASATNTITFVATGSPAVIDANSASNGLTISGACSYYIFDNLEVKNFTRYGLYFTGPSSARATFCTVKNCKIEAPATSSSTYRTVYLYYPNDCRFENCVFAGGGYVLYSQQMNRNVFTGCEFDGKNMSSRLIAPYNSNDSDNLYENCFFHGCGPSGLGLYINLSQYGNMFWHNTIIMKTSQNAVHLGGCCAWSRANSFRNNIVVNMGTGVCIKYGARSGLLEYNDAAYNCYYAPNGMAIEMEGGSKYTLANWVTYFNANKATLVPAGGGSTWDDVGSIEMDPGLVSMAAPYDIHLKNTSPCKDAGTTTYVAGAWISYNANYKVATDFEGDARPATLVDIGADEVVACTQLVLAGTLKIGTTVSLNIDVAADAGLPYQLASAFADSPGIAIDTRLLELYPDALFMMTISGLFPTIFQDYVGVLGATGKATGKLNIPNIGALVGLDIYSAFITLSPTAPSGVKTVSCTKSFKILS